MDPKGSAERVKDFKSKVLYPFKPLLQEFWGPPMAFIDTIGAHGFFLTFRGPQSKKGKELLH
jgi:hypothetical protein